METYGALRILSVILVWGIPAVLVLAVVGFIILAPAFAFGGLASRLYETTFARMRRKAQPEPAPTIGEILAAAGLTLKEEDAADKAVAAKAFMQQPVSEIDKLLAKAGLRIEEEEGVDKLLAKAGIKMDESAPKHCWEMLHCPPGKRDACPVYARGEMPCWVAVGLGKGGELREVCVNRILLDLKTLPS
ncbi:MAG: hypothetical protein Q8O16_07855 [Dehalococcoidia bacterium]|nr:hypothetical protein [Dehalococcoidia bacterium]